MIIGNGPLRPVLFSTFSLVVTLFLSCGCKYGYSLALESKNMKRRDLLTNTVVIGGSSILSGFVNTPVAAMDDNSKPIAILGASGRTGRLCVEACLKRGIPVRALTRSGQWDYLSEIQNDLSMDTINKLLAVAACDVKEKTALLNGIQGCQAVIYAASASKNGGTAKEIDNDGVVNAAKICCEQANIQRYIVVSSTATTRPKSLGYIFTNVMGGIMDEKRKGELGVYNVYTQNSQSTSSYTIIRPGGLEEPKKNEILGPSCLEISQGDVLAGIISRADLAEVAVELAISNAPNLRNTALELYYNDSVQPCEGRFKPLLTNGMAPRFHGDTYQELFRKVQPYVDVYEPEKV